MTREAIAVHADLMRAAASGALPRRETVRRGLRFGLGLAAAAALALAPRNRAAARGTSIPPNCIFVCCDGTCESWKMCMKCVKWPKETAGSTTLASAPAATADATPADEPQDGASAERPSGRRRGKRRKG